MGYLRLLSGRRLRWTWPNSGDLSEVLLPLLIPARARPELGGPPSTSNGPFCVTQVSPLAPPNHCQSLGGHVLDPVQICNRLTRTHRKGHPRSPIQAAIRILEKEMILENFPALTPGFQRSGKMCAALVRGPVGREQSSES